MKSIITKILLMCLLTFGISGVTNAQIEATIGSGTDAVYIPYRTVWMDSKTELLYTAAELTAAGAVGGNIFVIGFHISGVSTQVMNGFNIKMQNTATDSLTAFTAAGWTTVYSGTYSVPDTGWQMIVLNNPFLWDGTSNLLIQICFDNSSFTSSTIAFGTSTAPGLSWHEHQDLSSASGCDMTAGDGIDGRPNLRLVMFPALSCGATYKGVLLTSATWQDAPYLAGETDFWSFTGAEGMIYDFSLCANTEDSYLYLYDSVGNLLSSNDDSGPFCPTVSASMSYACQASGTYYVAASHYSCGTFNNNGNLAYRESTRNCDTCYPVNYEITNFPTAVYADSVSGNCAMGGKWVASFYADMNSVLHFDLCPDFPGVGHANFDIDIKITDASCAILTGQDGSCSATSYHPNDFSWTCPASGYYNVVLAPYPSYSEHNCGGNISNTFTLYYYKEPVVIDSCPPYAQIENEPLCGAEYVDNFNGGCNSTPNVFSVLNNNCYGFVCGKAGTFPVGASTYRDTDWYSLTLTDSTEFYLEGIAEFPLLLGIINGTSGCPSGAFVVSQSVAAGVQASMDTILGPGTWWIWAGPSGWDPVDCSSNYHFWYRTVNDPPAITVNPVPTCGGTTLAPIPSAGDVSYYWQGTSCGNSTTQPASSEYTVSTSGTYYVNAYNASAGCWSANCASATVTIHEYPADPVAAGQTICIGENATLTATSSATGLFWWDAMSGGDLIGDSSVFVTPVLSADTAFYVQAYNTYNNVGSLKIMEINIGSDDSIEIQNLRDNPVDVTGWVVAISDDYDFIDMYNSVLWNLTGTINPGEVLWRADAGGLNDWGANIFWTPDSPSWAMILDNNGAVVDFVSWGWPSDSIQSLSATINGFPVTIGAAWSGNGILPDSLDYFRRNTADNDDATDWSNQSSGNIGVSNNVTIVSIPDTCYSNVVAVAVTVEDCSGITENALEGAARILPNPNTGMFNVELNVKERSDYNLTIYNNLGQFVYQQQLSLDAGQHNISLDLKNQPDGNYYLRLVNNESTLVRTFVISK